MGVACEVNHLGIILQQLVQLSSLVQRGIPVATVGGVQQRLMGGNEDGHIGVLGNRSVQLFLQPSGGRFGELAVGVFAFAVDGDEVITLDHNMLVHLFAETKDTQNALNSIAIGLLAENSTVKLVVTGNDDQLRCGLCIGEHGVPGSPELFVFYFLTSVTDVAGDHNNVQIFSLELLHHGDERSVNSAIAGFEVQVTQNSNLHVLIFLACVICGQSGGCKQLCRRTQQQRKHQHRDQYSIQ